MELKRITNKKLKLKFNPNGGLSHASFEGQNVTSEIRYLEESDCAESLEVFGFKSNWDVNLISLFGKLNEALKDFNFSLFNIHLLKTNQYGVFLCDSKDSAFIHKTTRAVLLYNINESKFTQPVKLFEIDNKICNALLQEDWSKHVCYSKTI